jgi:hypothetical protein
MRVGRWGPRPTGLQRTGLGDGHGSAKSELDPNVRGRDCHAPPLRCAVTVRRTNVTIPLGRGNRLRKPGRAHGRIHTLLAVVGHRAIIARPPSVPYDQPVIRIGLVIAFCMLAVIVAAGGSPPAHAARQSHEPQPINVTLRFKMAEDMG